LIATAQQLDASDPLAFARERFRIPEDLIYLDGNSLGALPVATPDALTRTERQWGEELIPQPNGTRVRRDPLPRVDCRYLVTAWTTEVRDEHSLLGSVLSALLLNPVIQEEHLKGPFATVRPLPTVLLRSGDGSENSDFWSALGGQLKPGLDITVTATVDAAAMIEVGPPVAEIEIRAVPPEPPPARSAAADPSES